MNIINNYHLKGDNKTKQLIFLQVTSRNMQKETFNINNLRAKGSIIEKEDIL